MKKLYILLALLTTLFYQANSQTPGTVTCTANFEYRDSISSSPFVHYLKLNAIPSSDPSRVVTKVCWDFGDGTSLCTSANTTTSTASLLTTIHTYPQANVPYNTFNVCVTITYDGGCEAKTCRSVILQYPTTIAEVCTADFESIGNPAGTVSSTLQYFLAHPSDNLNKRPTRICWKFGDGRDTCIQYSTSYTGNYYVSHAYAQAGTYSVCVDILYDGGCEKSSCGSVTVVQPPATCSADFNVLSTAANSLTDYFDPIFSNSQNKKPISICWTFGDGSNVECHQYAGTFTGTYATYHTYANPGTYEVCVVIHYDGGCESRQCHTITIPPTVHPDTCSADFKWEPTLSNSLLNYFVASGWNNNNKKPVSVCWIFGDGTDQACQQYAGTFSGTYATSHTYAHAGTYEVCVIVTFDGGCTVRKCHTITVNGPVTCTADFKTEFAASNTLNPYFIPVFGNSSDKKPVHIYWYFGDGGTASETYAATYTGTYAVNHSYANAGTYTVCVTITYDGGCVASNCKSITVPPPIPPATCSVSFETLSSTATGLGKYFVVHPSNSQNKKPLQICWNFGDGRDTCIQYLTSFSGTFATYHLYAHAGTYTVCVSIYYDGGCSAKTCNTVVVTEPITCSADFTVSSVNSTPLGKSFTPVFGNSAGKKPLQIYWIFGDGGTYSATYASTYTGTYTVPHTYPSGGQFEVCVSIKYDGGCESRQCHVITIENPVTCSASFKVEPITTTPLGRHFIAVPNNSAGKKPVQICWYFGDNSNPVCQQYATTYTGTYSVDHSYANYGKYQVCISILYDGGCESKKCDSINIERPVTVCEASLYEVAATVTNPERNFYVGLMSSAVADKICWNFGDGSNEECVAITNPITQQSLTAHHTFPGPGVYHVCIKVTYHNGCVAEKCIEVTIRPQTVSTCGGYLTQVATSPRTIQFKGFSIHAANDNPVQFSWTFGDGSTGDGPEISHTYAAPGKYRACLFIRTASGCETRICTDVIVEGNAQPQLILSPNPVSTVLHVTFLSTRAETISIRIYNANGIVLRSYTRTVVAGSNTWDILDIGTLPTGVYSVVIQSSTQFANAIFFKQ